MTYSELIRSSLRLIGQLGPGRLASSVEETDALLILNRMLNSWSSERLQIYQIERSTYTITPSLQPHTIGTGGTFNTARPVRIDNAGVISVSGTYESGLKILTPDEWAAKTSKSLTSELPSEVYYDAAYPLGNLYLWPVPTTAATLALYTWKILSAVALTSATVTLPEGYEDALTYNLAVRLALEWGKPVKPEVAQLARETKQVIRTHNAPILQMSCDSALLGSGGFNILTGE